MQIHDTTLPEVKRISLDILRDARGFFCERFNVDKFAGIGMKQNWVQMNHSRSEPGVIRGLHFQHTPAQGKLVGVTSGSVLDVAVDIRPHSPRFGQYVAVELSDENGQLLWIPEGFAHGFCVLSSRPADVVYQLTATYHHAGESGIALDDATIGVKWPIALERAIISDRDKKQPTLAEVSEQLKRWFPK